MSPWSFFKPVSFFTLKFTTLFHVILASLPPQRGHLDSEVSSHISSPCKMSPQNTPLQRHPSPILTPPLLLSSNSFELSQYHTRYHSPPLKHTPKFCGTHSKRVLKFILNVAPSNDIYDFPFCQMKSYVSVMYSLLTSFFNKNASLQIYKSSYSSTKTSKAFISPVMSSPSINHASLSRRTLEASLEAQLFENRVVHLI